jgi:hypothetical protein
MASVLNRILNHVALYLDFCLQTRWLLLPSFYDFLISRCQARSQPNTFWFHSSPTNMVSALLIFCTCICNLQRVFVLQIPWSHMIFDIQDYLFPLMRIFRFATCNLFLLSDVFQDSIDSRLLVSIPPITIPQLESPNRRKTFLSPHLPLELVARLIWGAL